MLFDQKYYIEINEVRWDVASKIIFGVQGIRSCVDVGCGPGWFAERLSGMGFHVLGIDGRKELVEEASRRVPKARFSTLDITSSEAVFPLPSADLVFCFGLLYHLENPFSAIRNFHRLTGKFLLIETQVAPGRDSGFVLVSEGKNETQGLFYHAVIPSRTALVKMLYVAGFQYVYRYTGLVNHQDFVDTVDHVHRREMFLVSKTSPLDVPEMVHDPEPVTPKIDYSI